MKVLIAVDSSTLAEKTFDWYVKHLHKEENEVIVCHEAEQPAMPTMVFAGAGAFPADEVSRVVEEHKRKCLHMQKSYKKKCENSQITKSAVMIDTCINGSVGHGIIKKANEVGADLIVMGTRGMGALRRTILGSVSDYVLHHSHIPVVICHH